LVIFMKKEKWYNNGLAFYCRGCGNCCSGPDEGYVWVSAQEIKVIADFLKLPVEQLKKKFMRRVGLRYSLIEKQPGKDCIFLSSTRQGTKRCEIYPVRPLQCQTWPFWSQNLNKRDTWSGISQSCPGMDQGQWYDPDAIEKIRQGRQTIQSSSESIAQKALDWIQNNHNNAPALKAVEDLYQDIERHLEGLDPACENCGKCCGFENFGHRLYVTTLEMLYFRHGSPHSGRPDNSVNKLKFTEGKCPYQKSRGCTRRRQRPAGCRIFFCRDLPTDFQNELSEMVQDRLKRLHQHFQAVYYYTDWLSWLNTQRNHG